MTANHPSSGSFAAVEIDSPSEAQLKRAFRAQPHRFIDIGHSHLAYWKFGRGPDLVFIHGWPLDAATFRRIVPTLARSFTCHLFDLPGVGQSQSSPDAPIDFRSHAASIRRAIDALGLERYALVAHDSGALIARYVAADDPRTTALVLGDTEIPGHTPPLIIAYAMLARAPFGAEALGAVLRSPRLRRSAFAYGGCFTDVDYMDGDFHDLFIDPMLRSRSIVLAQLRPLRKLHKGLLDEVARAHRTIRAPVQLIWGTDDPFFPIEKARAMASTFHTPASFVEIPGGKVFPHEDHAEVFARHANDFLRKHLQN
ncbi:MAG: alpha/beta hydrolase [Polyangiaceae bacterium]|nr:alpha/beta hydrolase [Polyangiaceae bacterium]